MKILKICILILIVFWGCKKDKIQKVYVPSINISLNKERLQFGDSVEVKITVDSNVNEVNIFLNGNFISQNNLFKIDKNKYKLGPNILKVYAKADNKNYQKEKNFFVYSDIVPKEKSFRVITTYSHSRDAYTQGLFYHNNLLYETTGLEGKSSLKEIDLTKNTIIRQKFLDSKHFGEGSCVIDDKIYWLTWKSNTCFVIDYKTFEIVNTFYFSTEGWGLTTDGNVLFLSDGSAFIYKVDPANFQFVDTLIVVDNRGLVTNLNELEYVDDKIFANVYGKNYIVEIDAKTGKVLSYINFKNLLPDNLKDQTTDVFNGIAYVKNKKSFLVTGKNWPVIFEVVFE